MFECCGIYFDNTVWFNSQTVMKLWKELYLVMMLVMMVSMKIFMMKIQIFPVIVCKVALFTYHFILN